MLRFALVFELEGESKRCHGSEPHDANIMARAMMEAASRPMNHLSISGG